MSKLYQRLILCAFQAKLGIAQVFFGLLYVYISCGFVTFRINDMRDDFDLNVDTYVVLFVEINFTTYKFCRSVWSWDGISSLPTLIVLRRFAHQPIES